MSHSNEPIPLIYSILCGSIAGSMGEVNMTKKDIYYSY